MPFDIKSNLDISEDEIATDDPHGDALHHFSDSDDNENLLSQSYNSTHFSTTEDKFIKDHDLKVRAFEALQSPMQRSASMSSTKSAPKRRQSVIEFPKHPVPYHPTPSEASHNNNHTQDPKANANALPEEYPSHELVELFQNVKMCLDLRHKYLDRSLQKDEAVNPKNKPDWTIYPPPPKPTYKSKNRFNQIPGEVEDEEVFDFEKCHIPDQDVSDKYEVKLNHEDVYQVYDRETGEPISEIPTLHDYYSDLNKIVKISSDGPTKSFAFKRLSYLETKWNMYYLLNEFEENKQSKRNPHRDFYNVRKVDTHIHHSACMNQKHLLRFIKYKLKTTPDEQVIFRDGKLLTLAQVFESLNLSAYDLSIDTLDMHAHTDTFHRFDKFNLKYNPIGESRLREIFLKTDNFINGKYLAEITKQVFEDLESSKYQMVELRISVYGRSADEWDKLASWIVDNKLFSHNVRWLIQVPRLYDLYKTNGNVHTFQKILHNLFLPLYKVTLNPKSNPKLHVFLQRVVGFDSVDDESKSDKHFNTRKPPTACEWDSHSNPPYSYYLYYLYSDLIALNQLRCSLGYNTFLLRPHCGEAGDPEHLIAAFLTSHSISHGILLRKLPFVQYLYYLDQIGLAMSPLSNNALFLTYDKNPFFNFFKKGLNVSLSTDDPLQFSYTKEPLIEEYSVAAQIYKFSSVDMCELAMNSVKQSGWEWAIKKHWLGKNFAKSGVEGNDIEKTNVPNIRVGYREETLKSELSLVEYYNSLWTKQL
ncbi:putative AMP deaminase [Clavispora lusitaniae]|uniref:AMP deaminase n=1 Tax=Clavispora lusitaniae TaxID=36911 RepID=A0ACD0WJ01_CLALS|nr:putative AMP deaminase [Clavispora lusitaniae]QFZ33164.1 putative AMP deaminase [Clavispora lusitaniae]QFZ38835.1 putative AMP deaminase [Clavispora lusitaniae]QFZ44517.1 putative AMP deaminase [Clavispora lusitaniae]QFZ50194.1 putative AMP deaminase [Clavispora lusitaniae]